MSPSLRFAPREIFEQILHYAVIPTFDLILDIQDKGVILVRRKIAPYKGSWALPGLRMMKPERIDDTLIRIARQEAGLSLDPSTKQFIGQYVGRFQTEHQRQDISTCYALALDTVEIRINPDHFSGYRFVQGAEDIPVKTGAMYRYYLGLYLSRGKKVGK